jgi:hypothetical protein
MVPARAIVLLLAGAGFAGAAEADRAVAQWTLLHGGRVAIDGGAHPISDLDQLPEGHAFHLTLVDWVGVNAIPEDLARLSDLTHIRELRLPGPIWNRNADGGKNLSREMRHLSRLGTLQRITFSDHFLDRIRFTDEGLMAIGGLDNLREIAVRQAEIKGAGLKPFHLLEALDITLCPVQDESFVHVASMKGLRKLRAANTLITSRALQSLAVLEHLEELDLSATEVDDSGIPYLAGLRRLRRLDLSGNQITDAAIDTLMQLPALEELNLYRTKITNAGLSRLPKMPALRDLDVRYTRVTAAGVASLQSNARLRVVFHASSALRTPPAPPANASDTAAVVRWIGSLGGVISPDRSTLSLHATAINDTTVAALRTLQGTLRSLDLSGTEIGDAGLVVLRSFSKLDELNLDATAVTGAGLQHLPRTLRTLILGNTYVEGPGFPSMPALEQLVLQGAPVSDHGLEAICRAAPSLRHLNLGESDVTSAGLAALRSSPGLTYLDLAATDIDDGGLSVLPSLKGLTFLRLRETRLTDKGLAALANLTALQTLDLGRTRISNAGMRHLAGLTALRTLVLEYAEVNDDGVAVLRTLATLEDLNLDSTNVTNASIDVLATHTALKSLNLYHTLIDAEAHARLRKALPSCRIIWDPDSSRNNRRRA